MTKKTKTQGTSSFDAFADRRFRLAGKAILQDGHPYCVATDALESQSDQWPDGFQSFAHYDYLDLQRHPEVVAAAKSAIDTHGTGVGASRIVGGERLAHRALEQDLARFVGTGGALAVISGYLTNVSVINHVLGANDLLIADELAHNSIMVSSKSGRFNCVTYAHNDLDDLEQVLKRERGNYSRVLIATDGLFSMDGDVPDLPRLVDLKDAYDAWLLLDEAHSIGVLGETGRGLCEHMNVDPNRIELIIGTLSKSFASSGGFICATKDVTEWLRYTMPGFVFSVGLSPATIAGSHKALDILMREPERVQRLRSNSKFFVKCASQSKLETGTAIGEAVVPILFDTPDQCYFVADSLIKSGIYAPPVAHVGVPKDQPRIRFFLSAAHSEAQIEKLIGRVAAAKAAATPQPETISAE